MTVTAMRSDGTRPANGEDSDADERMRRVLLPVKHEAAAVISEMRQNKKWAGSGPYASVRSPLAFSHPPRTACTTLS